MDDFKDWVSFVGAVLLAFFLFVMGGVYERGQGNDRCKQGVLVVIDGKVYKCEPKS